MKLTNLLKLGFMPRWAIVFMDLFLCFGSVILSFLLRFNFATEKISSVLFIRGISVTLIVYFLCFFIFKSYKEIIRHTTFIGILRVLKAVALANFSLIIFNLVLRGNIPFWFLILYYLSFFYFFFYIVSKQNFYKRNFSNCFKYKKRAHTYFWCGDMGRTAVNQ